MAVRRIENDGCVELHWNCTFFALSLRARVLPMGARRDQLRDYFGTQQSGSPASQTQQRDLNIVLYTTSNRKLKHGWLNIICILWYILSNCTYTVILMYLNKNNIFKKHWNILPHTIKLSVIIYKCWQSIVNGHAASAINICSDCGSALKVNTYPTFFLSKHTSLNNIAFNDQSKYMVFSLIFIQNITRMKFDYHWLNVK